MKNELQEVLAEIGRRMPFIRHGQLICNLCDMAGRTEPGAVCDIEDLELLSAAREYLGQLRALPDDYWVEHIRAQDESAKIPYPVAG